jgi:hypothetical protein
MIRELSFDIFFEDVERDQIQATARALARLAKLVPREFSDLIYQQAIEVMCQSEMHWRIEDQIEDMEDYFDADVEESILYQADWRVEVCYDEVTEEMIEHMISQEQLRSLEEGQRTSPREFEFISRRAAKKNLKREIKETRQERQRYREAVIKAIRGDELQMERRRDDARNSLASAFKKELVDEERDRITDELMDGFGEALRHEATLRAKDMFRIK